MTTYEVKIALGGGYTVTEYWTVAQQSDLQFNAEVFYGKDALVVTSREIRAGVNA